MKTPDLGCYLKVLMVIWIHGVTLAQEPTLTLMPQSILKNLGEKAFVTCIAEVDQVNLVTSMQWRGPNGKLIPDQENPGTTLEDVGSPNQLAFLINKLRKEDAGEYTCSAVYAGNQKLEKSIQVTTYRDIDFGNTKALQTPKLYSDATIQCLVTAEPPPTVDWLKDGVLLKDSSRIFQQGNSILIKNITEADEGVYRCRAIVAELGELKQMDIQVEVHIAPSITKSPEDVEGVEKESVSFQCIALGKPPPTFTWVNKDSVVLNDKDGYFVNDQTGDLRILDIHPDHAGKYRCLAKNVAGEDFAEATLKVLTKPKVEKFQNITVVEGEDAKMQCLVSGDPLPDAIFQKESNANSFIFGINEDDRIDVLQQTDDQGRRIGVLQISDVSRRDDGLYSCTGSSSGGKTIMWGHITVEFKPTFEDQPVNEFWSWQNQPVNLTCLANAIPNATIQWYLHEQPIREDDPNLEVLAHGPMGVLKVHPVDGGYFDTYKCKATNIHGVTEHQIIFNQVQRPGPVSSAQVSKKTATTITWSIRGPLDNGGLDVLGYTVDYRLEGADHDKGEQKFWSIGSSYVVDNLSPLSSYIFRFAAKNQVGDGEWSSQKIVEMPKRNVPEEPLIFNVDQKTVKNISYPDRYTLQWQVPRDNGEPIQYYQISYYQVQNSSNGWDEIGPRETKTVSSPGQTTYKVEGLKSNSYYKIELRAYNSIGFSLPTEALIKTAFDPASSRDDQPGPSVEWSSVATSTPTNAQEIGKSEERESSAGLIAAIVIIVILFLLIILDVILYFAKNVGVTSFLVAKLATKRPLKDKEAMLEDGAKKSPKADDNSNQKLEKVSPLTEAAKDKEVSETTPMITGDSDKEAIKIEEKEREVEGAKTANTGATNEALSNDSAV